MKRYTKLVFTVLSVLFLSAQVNAGEGPVIKPVEKRWNFGTIRRDEIKEKIFKIKNIGDEKLTIEKVKACCGYKVEDVTLWTVEPGETSKLKISSDASRKRAGSDQKAITIISNDKNNPILKVPVYSTILSGDRKRSRAPSKAAKVPLMTARGVKYRIDKKEDITFLDVREKSEFFEKHISGSINLPRSRAVSYEDIPNKVLKDINKKKPIVVICGSGTRASFIAGELKEAGYNAYNMKGGIKAWAKEGYSLSEGPKTPPSGEPIVIGLKEAYKHYYKLFEGRVVWVDVRAREDYDMGHIEGAVNVGLNKIEENPEVLPKNKSIILYCDGVDCGQGFIAGKILIKNGYKQGKIRVLNEGFEGWLEEGYPTEAKNMVI